MYQGISLTQAPPFGVVISFFLNAFGFLCLAGIMCGILAFTDNVSALPAFVHIFTIGIFLSVMFGALCQMLPVLAGVRIKGVQIVSCVSICTLDIGLCALIGAFLGFGAIYFIIAMIGLNLGIFGFILSVMCSLFGIKHFTPTIYYMLAALGCLCVVSVLGAIMLGAYAGLWSVEDYISMRQMHFVLGGFGWIFLLIVGVCLQVLPMFYVAQNFSKSLYAFILPLMLCIAVFALVLGQHSALFASLSLVSLYFGINAIFRLKNRKRKIKDSSMPLWFLGFWLLIVLGAWLMVQAIIESSLLDSIMSKNFALISLFAYGNGVLFGGFCLCIISAMIFKIVPFLAWFHLIFKSIANVPNMRDFIPAKYIKVLSILLIFTLFNLACLAYKMWFICWILAGIGLCGMGSLGFWLILRCFISYKRILKRSSPIEAGLNTLAAANAPHSR